MEKKPSPHQIRKPGTKKPPAARSPRSTSTQKVRKGLDNGAPKARTPRKSQEKPAQFVDKNEPKSKLVENDDKDNESYLATRASMSMTPHLHILMFLVLTDTIVFL